MNNNQTPSRTGPSFLSAAAIPFFNMGVHRICANEIIQDPNLNHPTWLSAYAALTADNFSPTMMAVLQHPSIPGEFSERVIAPLQADDHLSVRNYLYDLFSYTPILPGRLSLHPHDHLLSPPPLLTPPLLNYLAPLRILCPSGLIASRWNLPTWPISWRKPPTFRGPTQAGLNVPLSSHRQLWHSCKSDYRHTFFYRQL